MQIITLLISIINKAEFQSPSCLSKGIKGTQVISLTNPFSSNIFHPPHTLSRDSCLSIPLSPKHFPTLSST